MTRAQMSELAGAALRIVAGAMFMCHGLSKIFGWPAGPTIPLGTQLGVGGLIELVCGALIAVGLFARPAAFLASGTMAVAYFQFHFDPHGYGVLPIVNHGEPAVLYCFIFLVVAAAGAGRFSLDHKLRGV